LDIKEHQRIRKF